MVDQSSTESKQKDKIKYSTLNGSRLWETGVWNRLPWLGISALLGVVLCLAFNVVVLIISNKQPTNKWQIQPSVLLAISSAASNGLLRFAMAEGAVIAWWIKAIEGCTVNDLHRYWSFANSIYDAMKKIRFFNVITLASIASVIIAVDNPLFQRALTISVQPFRKDIAISVPIAQQIPESYTGMIQGYTSPVLSGMTTIFEEVMKGYNSRAPMYLNNSGCGTGNCSGTIKAAGFAVDCSRITLPYDFGSIYVLPNGTEVGSDYNGTFSAMANVMKVTFSSNFTFDVREPSTINFTVAYKDKSPCKSQLQVNHCTFRPATLKYPVNIENGTVTFSSSLSSLGTTPETVVAVYSISEDNFVRGSTLGGFYLAASDLLTSEATIWQVDHIWTLNISGTLAQDYVTSINSMTACEDTWSDPTEEVISSLQEIMFRTALSASNDSSPFYYYSGVNASHVQTNQTMNTVEVSLLPAFQVHYGYLAAGVAVMIACVVPVASTFYGWWRIGRPISLSPIEIAKAFNAPLLQGKGSNCELDELLDFVGNRPVRYGEVKYRGGKMISPDEAVEGETVLARLQMAYPDLTTLPQRGVQYV